MITPTKTYSSNPFVDNLIYYAKMLALNCTVKHEEEALKNETKETLNAGNTYINCIEKRTTYEMFENIPVSILEKYITRQSNLDLYASNPKSLNAYLNSLSKSERKRLLESISELARNVYIDHYDIMSKYVNESGFGWLEANENLYNKCVNSTADYKDLFDVLPLPTVSRIVKKYLNNHDYYELHDLWNGKYDLSFEDDYGKYAEISPADRTYHSIVMKDDGSSTIEHRSYEEFSEYVNSRTDTEEVQRELDLISQAMRNVFINHYDIIRDRKYFANDFNRSEIRYEEPEDGDEEFDGFIYGPIYEQYYFSTLEYNRCKSGNGKFETLYECVAHTDLLEALNSVLGEYEVSTYNLDTAGVDALIDYFNNYDTDPETHIQELNEALSDYYLKNYQFYLNSDMYYNCKDRCVDYFDLVEYLPTETKKSIIAKEIGEFTNLDVYSSNKKMLNSYLSTLDRTTANRIKESINKEMQDWYPANHIEKNNYYRTLIGLPPIDSNGRVCVDTLEGSWSESEQKFIRFSSITQNEDMIPINQVPEGVYGANSPHWTQEIYKFDNYDIGILNEYGIIDYFLTLCKSDINDTRYKYFKYLGGSKLDLYTCRKAMNFELIGLPIIDSPIAREKFVSAFAVSRDYVIRTVYADAYKFQSTYYDKFIIIFILFNAIMDMLSGISELIINRDVFDARCIKFLFESYGIPYYSEIPVKYQQAMLKNLNILIKYKSSTRNMIDICNLFGFSDIRVFGYYLMKERIIDQNTGEYAIDNRNDIHYELDDLYVKCNTGTNLISIDGTNFIKLSDYPYFTEKYYLKTISVKDDSGNIVQKQIIDNSREVYVYNDDVKMMIPIQDADYFYNVGANLAPASLKFIRVPIDEQLTDFKNDYNNFTPYDEITLGEVFWDGELNHNKLKKDIMNYEFNAVKTKYISVETLTQMTELSFQVAYFYNMLFDNLYSEENLTVEVPYIKVGHTFKFVDIVSYLFAMMYYYHGLEDNIMYSPTQILYIKGYNFDEDLNTILQDPTAFTQEDENGNPLQDYQKVNIFDINERIEEDNYDYQEAFKDYDIRSFNLNVDIDALDRWLIENYQMSLDDFIVDDSQTTFDQVITLRNFYSLNNSYYQKSIFKDNLLPLQFNNEIKYAFDYDLYIKIFENDISGVPHTYAVEKTNDLSYIMEIIDIKDDDTIYIMDNNVYVNIPLEGNKAVYKKYIKDDNAYILQDNQYYVVRDNSYTKLFDNLIYVKNRDDKFVFATDKVYRYINSTNTYEEITEPQYYYTDPSTGYTLLNLIKYYVLDDTGKYVIDPDNAWVKLVRNGVVTYELFKNLDDEKYQNPVLSDEDCFIRHSDGHFIRFSDTDFFVRTGTDTEDYKESELKIEDLYVPSKDNAVTEYYDPSDNPRVYYEKVSDFYNENNYTIYRDELLVKDDDGNYIPANDVISPYNCYYISTPAIITIDENGEEITSEPKYTLVINNLAKYIDYTNPKHIQYYLILQEDYDYWKLEMSEDGTVLNQIISNKRRYVYDSYGTHIVVLDKEAIYEDTEQMIVVFNKAMNTAIIEEESLGKAYNPSLNDNIWDENDWFYRQAGYNDPNSIGMNAENIWYYRTPGQEEITPIDSESSADTNVASGWYMEASSFLGDVELEQGKTYYIEFEVLTNFNGEVQIYLDADDTVVTSASRVYSFKPNEYQHISQQIVANNISRPSMKFLKWDFENYPINPGDYMVISDIKIMKAYSDQYIPTDIPSYDKLQLIYRTNEAIYKYLVSMMNNTSDFDTYQIYKKLFDALMTSKYNKEAFKIGENKYAKTYTEFLQSRDEVLFERLNYFKSLDEDAMHKIIADNIIEVTYAIDDCVDTYSYGYLYSYFPAVSANYIQQYISKIINWFKSWKVHLLGISTMYKMDDAGENTVRILERMQRKIKLQENTNHTYITDSVHINPFDGISESGVPYKDLDGMDFPEFTNYIDDTVKVHDTVRVISSVNHFDYEDNVLFLELDNHMNIAKCEDDNMLIIESDEDEFYAGIYQESNPVNNKDIVVGIMNMNSPQDLFEGQNIWAINYNSGSYIDFEDLEEARKNG